jgi:2'-5' RNA ligase
MPETIPNPYRKQEFIGYYLVTYLSEPTANILRGIQRSLIDRFPDIIEPQPIVPHVTLMDWITPLADYHQDKDEIFKGIVDEYGNAFEDTIKRISAFDIVFGAIGASPEAVFMTAKDNGQYATIRNGFNTRVKLLPQTKVKRDLDFIHSTVARFKSVTDLGEIEEFASHQTVSVTEKIDSFMLCRASNHTGDSHEPIKTFYLK